jgi:Kef-type K+ transport system membrane component KefB
MTLVEQAIPALLVILLMGLLVPDLFKRLKMPFVTSIIIVGAVLGPNGVNYVQPNEIITFFGFLGSAFLMLMAGLEVKLEHFQKMGRKIIVMAALNGAIPFIVGFGIVIYFGYSVLAASLIGTVFISSSVAVVIMAVREAGLLDKEIGQAIVSVVVLEDVLSLLLLALILQGVSPITFIPVPIYFGVLIASIVGLKKFLHIVGKYYFKAKATKRETYEKELRFVLVIMMAVLLYFSGLGVHPIVAAFVVGLLLSDAVKSEKVYEKLHAMSYGLFVPVFFFIVGMEIDLGILASFDYRNTIMVSIIFGLIAAKVLSGYIAGRGAKFSKRNSLLFGTASMTQLTTTLAVTYAAVGLGILDSTLVTSIIILSVITTVLAPMLLNLFSGLGVKKPLGPPVRA